MFPWLRHSVKHRAKRHRQARSRPCKPLLEALEDRRLLAVSITEFPLPTADANPFFITSGPDGNLWFTEFTSGKIGRITPGGNITEFALPPPAAAPQLPLATSGPSAITTGPDGNLWFLEALGSRLGRITPSGTITEFPVATAGDFSFSNGIVAGPDGNVWFGLTGFAGGRFIAEIARVTPAGSITEFPVPSTIDEITVGPDGALWFTEAPDNRTIGRITTSGTVTEFALPPGLAATNGRNGIAQGPDGNLWFTALTNEQGVVGRLTTSGAVTLFPAGSSTPADLTAGPDGHLWFTTLIGGAIGQITTSGAVTYYATSTIGTYGITTGPDGNLWVTEAGGTAANKIARVSLGRTSPAFTPNQNFVAEVYRDLLGRPADAPGLGFWSGLLAQGQSRAQVVQGIENSQEYRTDVVMELYAKLLIRPADPSGLQNGVSLLTQGASIQQLDALLVSSEEYFSLHGGTSAGFVQAAYQDVLGRAASATEVQPWLQVLAGGASRQDVAAAILTSSEAEGVAVQTLYERHLQRAADASGLSFFIGALQQGASLQQVRAVILASPEFFSTVNAVTEQVWLMQLYSSILLHPADAASTAYWTSLLDQGLASPFQVALQIEQSSEAEAVHVQEQYQRYLGRGADPDGLNAGVNFLTHGGTREQWGVLLTSSPEYFQKAGGTNAGFLNAVYQDALGRPLDPAGLASFGQALAAGATRAQVAGAIFSSDEYRTDLVQSYYQRFLGRAADAASLTGWTGLLRQGGRDEQVAAALLASDEFFARPR